MHPPSRSVALALASAFAAQGAFAQAPTPAPTPTPANPVTTTTAPQTDVTRAREHFEVGQSLYRVGRFAESAAEFQLAYELSREPLLLQNIYLAYRDAGDVERAADYLRRYLEVATQLQPGDRAALQRRLDALDQTVARRRADAEAQAAAARAAEEARVAAEAQAAAIAAEVAARDAEEAEQSAAESGGDSGGPGALPLSLLGVAGAGAITAAITGPLALRERGSLEDRCSPACTDSEVGTLRTLGIVTDVGLGLAVAAGTTGLVLLLVGRGDDEASTEARVTVLPLVAAERRGLAIVGRF